MTRCLVALDVDGTLVDETNELFGGAMDLVRGVPSFVDFALCSARPLWSLVAIAEKLGNVSYIAALQGAVVAVRDGRSTDYPSGAGAKWRTVYQRCFTKEELRDICSAARASRFDIWAFGSEKWCVEAYTSLVRREQFYTGRKPAIVRSIMGGKFYKIVVVVGSRGASSIVERLAKKRVRHSISKGNYIEIVSRKASRYKGLDVLAGMSANKGSIIAAVGDSGNDIGMLEFADVSFTFASSHPSIKNRCNVVLPDPSGEGLVMLRRIISQWGVGGEGENVTS